MQSNAKNVDAYIHEAPEQRRQARTREGLSFGKGGIIDFAVVKKLLAATYRSKGPLC